MRTFDINYETQDSNDYDYQESQETFEEEEFFEETFDEELEIPEPVSALDLQDEIEKDMKELELLEKEGKLSYDVQIPEIQKTEKKEKKKVPVQKRVIEDPRVVELKAWALSKGLTLEQLPVGFIDDLYAEMKIQMEYDAKEAAAIAKASEPETRKAEYKPRANQRQVLNAKGKLQGIKKLAPLPEKKKCEIEIVPKVEVVYQPTIDFEEAESFEFAPIETPQEKPQEKPIEKPVQTPEQKPEKMLLVNQKTSRVEAKKAEAKAQEKAIEKAQEKAQEKESEWQTVTKKKVEKSVEKSSEKPIQRPQPQTHTSHHTNAQKFTRMCRSVLEGVKCRHHTCLFAHDVAQLTPVPCRFGCDCNFVRKSATVGVYENTKPSVRVCSFWHPKEIHESFGRRQGYPVSSRQRPQFATPKKV